MYRFKALLVAVMLGLVLAAPAARAASFDKVTKLARECQSGKEKACRELLRIAQADDNKAVRLAAVEHITDQSALTAIATADNGDRDVRLAAVKKLTDPAVRIVIARTDRFEELRVAAVDDLTDLAVLVDLANLTYEKDWPVYRAVKRRCTDRAILASADPELLARVARQNGIVEIRIAAVRSLHNQSVLAEIAQNDDEHHMRLAAVENLTDQPVLASIAKNDTDLHVQVAAMKNLTDPDALADLARTSKDQYVRLAATRKITDRAILQQIALKDTNDDVRIAAAMILGDETVFAEIALTASGWSGGKQAVGEIHDPSLLARIAREQHDSIVREAAAERFISPAVLSRADSGLLVEIAREGPWRMAVAAVTRIADPAVLVELARSDREPAIRVASVNRLENTHPAVRQLGGDLGVLTESALSCCCRMKLATQEPPIRSRFPELAVLCEIACQEKGYGVGGLYSTNTVQGETVRMRLVEGGQWLSTAAWSAEFPQSISSLTHYLPARVSGAQLLEEFFRDPEFTPADLAELARSTIPEVRKAAAATLADQTVLTAIARTDKNPDVRITAVKKLVARTALADIAQSDTDGSVRRAAAERLAVLRGE